MVRKSFARVGGRLCLDFVNTVAWRGTDEPRDDLATFEDLIRFCESVGICSRDRARSLRKDAERHPRRAANTLARARRLREALFRVVVAWKRGRSPTDDDAESIHRSAPPRMGVVWRRGSVEWRTGRAPGPDALLWPIAWSAEELLVSGDRRRLKSCGSDACGWLFYDESLGRKRRWCSMSDCGNRAKAKRFYARNR